MEVTGCSESDFSKAFSMETQPHQLCAIPACTFQSQRTVLTSLHEPIIFHFLIFKQLFIFIKYYEKSGQMCFLFCFEIAIFN